ncbi:unnamed protein product [Cylindrotheca closterium]|uniref:Uncharacterized protein n=1 Tax=Cylindrotheca closterium TaxID=2856 RepID=A0AAD2GDL9_9STRA|nr:unnamed protein product [Cylindrotheca closterium]
MKQSALWILPLFFIYTFIMPNYAQQTIETEPLNSANQQDDYDKITMLNPLDETEIEFVPTTAFGSATTWTIMKNQFQIIPDKSVGFVDPTSVSVLWQAVDLQYPSLRLALGLHIRNGQIQHLFPTMDLFYGDGDHRNRGLNTVPRAHTWLSISSKEIASVDVVSLLSSFQMTMATRNFKKGETQWTIQVNSIAVKEALETAIYALAEDPPSIFGQGSHFLHVPLNEVLDCPKVGQEVRIELHGPQKMEHSTGVLQIKVQATQAGSKSEHIPKVYEPLFQNPKYQRKEYFAFQKKKESRIQKEKEDSSRRVKERKEAEL